MGPSISARCVSLLTDKFYSMAELFGTDGKVSELSTSGKPGALR